MPFSHDEIRRFAKALRYVEQEGGEAELQACLNEAAAQCPAADPWENAAVGSRIEGVTLARKVAKLLGIEMERAHGIVAQELGKSRQRAVFDVIIECGRRLYAERKKAGKAKP